jgi:hypothetical protein
MARHEASASAAGVDFHLSDEILAVILKVHLVR